MKNIKLSFLTWACVSSMVFAGGDIDAPVEPLQEQVMDTPEAEMSEKSDFYAGLLLSVISTRESGVSLNFASGTSGQVRIGNAGILAGYDINPYVAVEARYSASIAKKDNAKMSSLSVFIKPQYPVSEELSVYGLLGYGQVKIDSKNQSNVDVSKGAFQWGLGVDYEVIADISMFVEYASLAHNIDGTFLTADSASVDALNVGLTYRF